MAINISAVSAVLSFDFSRLTYRRWEAALRSSAWLSGALATGTESSSGSRFIAFFFGCDDAGGLRPPLSFERPTAFGGGMVTEGEEIAAAAQGFGKWREDWGF